MGWMMVFLLRALIFLVSKDPFLSLDDVSDRIRYIRDELGSVLEEDLDHIKVDSLIRGDTTAVFYLLEIIAAIVALWVFPKLDFMNEDFYLHSGPPPQACSPEMPRSSTRACLPPPSATGESVLRTKAQASSSYGDCHKVDDHSSDAPIQCVDGGYQVWPSEVAALLAASPPATPREKDHVEIVPSSCSPKPPGTPPSPMHLCMLQSTDSGLRSSPRGDDSSSDLEEKGKVDIDAGTSAATCPSSVSGIYSTESCSYRDEVFWAADQEASSTAAHSTRPWSHDVSNIRRNAKRVHRRAIAVDDLARSLSSFAQDMCYRQRGLAKRSRQLAQFRACLVDLRDSLAATTSQIDMLLEGSHDNEDSTAAGETVSSFGRLHAPHPSLNRPKCVGFAPRVSSTFSEIEMEKRRLDRECESLFYAKQRCTADFFDLMLRKLKGCSPTLPTPIA
nr:unnamed protein product [Spirometra erinaceieuropaei]